MTSKKAVAVLDGGTGSSLIEMGHNEIQNDPLWSALLVHTSPQTVINLHKTFLQNGADVIVSATYQASLEGYVKRFGVTESQAAELVTEGVNLARQARDDVQAATDADSTSHRVLLSPQIRISCSEVKDVFTGSAIVVLSSVRGFHPDHVTRIKVQSGRTCWVAASVGPYGAILCDRSEYHGRYAESMSFQELTSWHAPRLAAILKGQPDLLAVETIPVVKEAGAILEVLKSFPAARAWVSFQCKDGAHTGHGENIVDAVRTAAQSDQVVAVGVNCTSPSHVLPILQSVDRLHLAVPVLVKPNRGSDSLGYVSDETASPSSLADLAREWIDLGASMVGGCCHYGPDDIAALRRSLEARDDICLPGMPGLIK